MSSLGGGVALKGLQRQWVPLAAYREHFSRSVLRFIHRRGTSFHLRALSPGVSSQSLRYGSSCLVNLALDFREL